MSDRPKQYEYDTFEGYVDALEDHAETLERERDEARLEVENHKGAINIAIDALDKAITMRDEAREIARELRAVLETFVQYAIANDAVINAKTWAITGDALAKAKEVLS